MYTYTITITSSIRIYYYCLTINSSSAIIIIIISSSSSSSSSIRSGQSGPVRAGQVRAGGRDRGYIYTHMYICISMYT